MESIFISHASKDREITEAFIDEILHGALEIKISDIFCTTTDGTKIKSGDDWRDAIKQHLCNAKITFLIITPNYKESEICLNEMGAAWVLSSKTIPLIVEPIDYASVGLLQEVKQVEKLQDEKSLDRIRDIVQDDLEISPKDIRSDRWTTKKKQFLTKLEEYLRVNPFGSPVTRDQIEYLEKENQSLLLEFKKISEDKDKFENLCSELKKVILSKETNETKNENLDITRMSEFKLLCENVKRPLSKLNGLVRAIIYVDYSGKEMSFNLDGWDLVLQQAFAKDILLKDNWSKPNWKETKDMRNICSGLKELKEFIDRNKKNDLFTLLYEQEYDAPLNLTNIDFWTEAFGLTLVFE